MRGRRYVVIAVLMLGSCTSHPRATTPFTAGLRGPTGAASTFALPRSLPPAAIFIGSSAWRSSPSRYCLQGACRTLNPSDGRVIEGPSGSPVLFSLPAAPLAAHLVVRNAGARGGALTVPLEIGTAMVWQASIPAGTYPLTLVATYATTEVEWPFALRLSPAASS